MSEAAPPSEIQINIKGPSELKLQITISTDKSVLELKQAIADKSDVEADRQRLIYSGRVLKDDDALSVYKIQSSHTIHMVKGVARSGASSQQQQGGTPQALPTMQAGQNPHDPLTQLNSHLGYGALAGVNPFADMGLNPNDPNMMQTMLNSPQLLEQMASVMSNPQVLDQIIASNPQLAAMGPQVREIFQSENFRQMMSNPESLRMMMQMASMMHEPGQSPFAGMGGMGGGGFPAPGIPTTNATTNTTNTPTTAAGASNHNPNQPQPLPNLFAGMFPPGGAGAGGAAPAAGGMNPAMWQQFFGGMGGGAGAGGMPFGAGFGGTPVPPADTRSPEERFQVQLQQLNDMGFTNASQNVRALLATAGNVHSAIEYILSGGGL